MEIWTQKVIRYGINFLFLLFKASKQGSELNLVDTLHFKKRLLIHMSNTDLQTLASYLSGFLPLG